MAGPLADRLGAAPSGAAEVQAAEELRIARAAETAWNLGAEHGRAGSTPFGDYSWFPGRLDVYTDYVSCGEGGPDLARVLGLPGGADHPAAESAIGSYCDAYWEAAGLPFEDEDEASAGRAYPAGQQVSTALGRSGVLTGEAGAAGNPRVRFADGTVATVPQQAIIGPPVHVAEQPADGTPMELGGPSPAGSGSGSRPTLSASRRSPAAPGELQTVSTWARRFGDWPDPVLPKYRGRGRGHGAACWWPSVARFLKDHDLPDRRLQGRVRCAQPRGRSGRRDELPQSAARGASPDFPDSNPLAGPGRSGGASRRADGSSAPDQVAGPGIHGDDAAGQQRRTAARRRSPHAGAPRAARIPRRPG